MGRFRKGNRHPKNPFNVTGFSEISRVCIALFFFFPFFSLSPKITHGQELTTWTQWISLSSNALLLCICQESDAFQCSFTIIYI